MKTRNWCVWSGSLIALILLVPAILLGRFHWLASPRGFVTKESSARSIRSSAKSKTIGNYDKLPLAFEPNLGQADPRVRFLAHGNGYELFFTEQETVLTFSASGQLATLRSKSHLWRRRQNAGISSGAAVLRMRLKGSNPAPQIIGLDELPGKFNYFIGNDPKNWHGGVPSYGRIEYQEVYPSIDMAFRGEQGRLENDLDRKSTRLNSSHGYISYAVFCLKKKKK